MRKNYITLFFILLVSACIPVQSLSETPTPTSLQLTSTSIASLTSTSNFLGYTQVDLSCEDYVETTWGNGSGQWGDPVQLGRAHDLVPPLAFNSQSELFFSDFANHRLMKYDGHTTFPAQVIPLPESYFSFPIIETLRMPWSMITVTDNNIVVPYDVNRIGIFSFDGQELKNIQLPKNFDFSAPGWHLAWVDTRGGLLLKGRDGAYFDVGWENNNWQAISTKGLVNPFSWEGYLGDLGSIFPTIQLYQVDLSIDFMQNPSVVIDTGIDSTQFSFVGVDGDGWLYLGLPPTGTQNIFAIARFSIPSRTKQIGVISDGISAQIIRSSVAPDGTIYLIVFDKNDVLVSPKLVKCNFP